MVTGTVKHEEEYRYPEDQQFSGKLVSVNEEVVDFIYKEGSAAVKNGRAKVGEAGQFKKWRWTFAFVGGEFDTQRLTLDTNAGITNRADNMPRIIAETLLGREMGIGEDFNSDSIVGLPCLFTVRHQPPSKKKDGTMGYYCEVADIFPASTSFDEPPF